MAIIGKFIANFCALFLAINIIGHLIAYLSISAQLQSNQGRKILLKSINFIFLVSISFMFICWLIFALTGISPADLQIAAGVLLFSFSIYALLNKEEEISPAKSSTLFPAAAQLIITPVFLVMLLVLMSLNGFIITLLSLLINLILVVYLLVNSQNVIGLLEHSGVKIISRVVNMLICAYAVMLIRQAIITLLN
ncbi:MAG: MarC family protein [Candidatus Omnitrophota bacterium]